MTKSNQIISYYNNNYKYINTKILEQAYFDINNSSISIIIIEETYRHKKILNKDLKKFFLVFEFSMIGEIIQNRIPISNSNMLDYIINSLTNVKNNINNIKDQDSLIYQKGKKK